MPIPDALHDEETHYGAFTPQANIGSEIRENLHYDTVRRYKNFCCGADAWWEYNAGTWTLSGNWITLTERGYPAVIPAGKCQRSSIQSVWTMYPGNGGRNNGTFPDGPYVFTYSGDVDNISVNGTGVTVTSTNPGRIEFTSDGTATIYLEISGTIYEELRDFVICEARYEGDWETGDLWYPEMRQELAGFSTFDLGIWFHGPAWPTTSTPYPTWDQVRSKDYYGYHTQPVAGAPTEYVAGSDYRHMPYEVQANLINWLGCNIWLTIPYWASDDFTASMAEYFSQNLHPDATIYIEYCGEPFWEGNSITPFSMGGKYCFDQGTLAAYPNPQVDFYVYRAQELFTIFKEHSTHTVIACIVSKTINAGRPLWIENLLAHVLAGHIDAADEWSTGFYVGCYIDYPGGGMGHTWNWWHTTGTADDVNNILNTQTLSQLTDFDTFVTTVAAMDLPIGLYEFGVAALVGGYEGQAAPVPAQADIIGDLVREAIQSEQAHWRITKIMNHVLEEAQGLCLWFCAPTCQDNQATWGLADTNLDLKRRRPIGEYIPHADHPRYYAMREFIRGDRHLTYMGACRR